MFKAGDKVVCVDSSYSEGHLVECVHYIIDDVDDAEGVIINGYWWYPNRFKFVEEKPQFDLKKNPWFIRTGTKEKSEAAQKWLFEQGMSWSGARGNVILNFGEDYLVNVSGNGYVGKYVMWCSDSSPHASAKEIVLEFETVVKSVTYPVVETAQDKKIKELKETIDKAQQQLEEMIGK